MTGIYIHVPFCARKCPYCDFYSQKYTLKAAEAYKNAVVRNISLMPDITADTVYFGGGTPSILPAEYIAEIMYALSKNIILDSPEVTMEANPGTVTANKLKDYKTIGINRLSLGVQSGDDGELEFLGRNHTFEKAEKAVRLARDAGFKNISCDVMIGVKGQTMDKLEKSIKKIIKLPVQHISSYILKVEEKTPFGRNGIGKLLPDDDSIAELYLHCTKLLENAGFIQYEISNFSKEGFESRHNLKYWKCMEYIGIGPSAHSYFDGRRYHVPDDLESFCKEEHQKEVYEDYVPGTYEEKIMLGLRLNDGIQLDDFPEKKASIMRKAVNYSAHGFAVLKDGRLILTPKGFLVSNLIISDILYE